MANTLTWDSPGVPPLPEGRGCGGPAMLAPRGFTHFAAQLVSDRALRKAQTEESDVIFEGHNKKNSEASKKKISA